ncbi:MAG: hypothetical protein C0518_08170 [Opitutus sp.]|nr:hypothetical protein [Opitutus sp.]
MTHFPHRPSRPAAQAPGAHGAAKAARSRDVLWGRPVFKAPQLNVRPPLEPLPFTAARITQFARPKIAGAN